MLNIRWLSSEKKALMISRLLPLKVNGKKSGSLCSDIIFRVKSALHVSINLESLDHVTPVIGYECRLPYFL